LSHLLNLLAAIALLVWGTYMVRTDILRVFGANLRSILASSVRNRIRATISGIGVTALLQSSTATALIVSAVIVYTAWQVFKEASVTLSDAARIRASEICEVALGVGGVLGCHSVRTRGSEAEVYVDMHIQVDAARTVADGHRIAELTERTVAEHFDRVADVIVHLEPFDEYQAGKTNEEQRSGLV